MTALNKTTTRRFSPARATLLGALLTLCAWLLPVAAAQAAPAWGITVAPIGGGYFAPGANGNATEGPGFLITVTNTGDEPTNAPYTITDTLPVGVNPPTGGGIVGEDENGNVLTCGTVERTITCEGTAPLAAGEEAEVTIPVDVPLVIPKEARPGIVNTAKVNDGGAASPQTASSPRVFLTSHRPAWLGSLASAPTNFAGIGSPWKPNNEFFLDFSNVGGAPSSAVDPIVVTVAVSAGLTPTSGSIDFGSCQVGVPTAQEVTCTITQPIFPGRNIIGNFDIDPGALPDGAPVGAEVSIAGGAAQDAQVVTEAIVDSSQEAPFDFLPGHNGIAATLTGLDGLPATQAGSHPGSFAVQTGIPTSKGSVAFGTYIGTDGGVKDSTSFLPPGFVINPQALVQTCPEAKNAQDACPTGSAVGIADVQSNYGFGSMVGSPSALYAVDAPPGTPTSFSFNAFGIGLYPHINGRVRPGGDYAFGSFTTDLLAFGPNPLAGLRLEFWGDSSDPAHDRVRGVCNFQFASDCPADTVQTAPLLSLPTSCGGSMSFEGNINSWQHPADVKQGFGQVIDPLGNPTGVTGCNALEFAPTIEARPTTNVADAPSGLDVSIKVPQSVDFNTLATAHLKKAVLSQGLLINPAGANGLSACSSSQIGIDPGSGEPNGNQPTCPDSSKIGRAQVLTSLLDHPMPGNIYLAAPHDNPFDSLLATYVVVDDKRSGTLIKLAGEVEADPTTGRLTATFDDQPQLPFDEFKLNFFGGAAAVLRTPAICGKYTSSTTITPWSGGLPATPSDSYAITNAPTGGTCPESVGAQPNAPSFDAGTVAPIAGAHSPLVINLRRPDGSQEFSSLTVTPPPGLIGKLAGIPACPDSALSAAAAKTGTEERQSPSCPLASDLGTLTVGTGAGPAPYYVQGRAYLTGPYKGAPIGVAFVTPAIAGPFDLGTVVVRAALHLNPANAQITANTDELPTILQGIPLDIRSAQVKLDRPNFTLNPTNCDPMSYTGQLVSTLGQSISLLNRFQVAECVDLGFKPGLSLRLKGGTKRTKNPALIANLKPRAGDANFARAQVRLPVAAFLDQTHIGTVCTRVQFSASKCPPDSVYGSAEATSPLVDYPVSGPVYLRSSDNKLPDLVADLRGPAYQPVKFELVGKTDSVKGALRSTFEATPDVPVSSLRLELVGGKKGLIELSRNLCAKKYRAAVQFDGQNGKTYDVNPVVASDCKGKKKARKHRRAGGAR